MDARGRRVQRAQVDWKREDAKRRCLDATLAACRATSAEEYERIVLDGVRAARDYETWSLVAGALQ